MSRKSQHKNARKAVKRQRSTPSKPWVAPSPQTHPAIKISEAILNISEPLRMQYREPHRMQAIIAVAVMAWNIALFPDEEHAQVQGMLLESLPPQLSGEDVGVLLSTMDTLIARKRLLYPQVREYILTHQLTLVDNKVTLSVGTAPVPETIQRRSPSCGHAGTHNERHRLSAAHGHRV
jgi:hypothetical protein